MRTRKGYIHQKGQQLYNMLEGKKTLLDCVLFCDAIYGEALIIDSVVVPKGTLCDCKNQPYWKEPCDDCMEGYSERWQP